jgi:hypothetical protein
MTLEVVLFVQIDGDECCRGGLCDERFELDKPVGYELVYVSGVKNACLSGPNYSCKQARETYNGVGK